MYLRKRYKKKITNFISLEPNKSPYASIQPKIDGFLVRKPKAPFIPVDLTHPSSINKKRGPGRPPKYPLSQKKVKKEQISNSNVEVVEVEEFNNGNDNTGKRGTYSKISHQTRKTIIEKYMEFKENPPKDSLGKFMSFNDFADNLANTLAL